MPVPQENSSIVERASCPACSTRKFIYCGTGILPGLFHKKIHLLWNGHLARLVPQENSSIVERASCPLLTGA
ncbi:MAG: hypothetical protein QQW96_16905 [Tychonema bourrellyi B0820]|nr:hypothetical protein [Tychonema bourrellyi B0820]